MPTSFGVVLLARPGLLFLAHATSTSYWDLPKGGGDPGETALESALREMDEEAGIRFDAQAVASEGFVVELGLMPYRKGKQLHLFAARVDAQALQPEACRCTSFFEHRVTKKMIPEVDTFKWVPFEDIDAHCAGNMAKVLTASLNLRELLERLPVMPVAAPAP